MSLRPGGGWRYWQSGTDGLLDIGLVRGGTPGLRAHFHSDVQITMVLEGRRVFHVAGLGAVELSAGRCLCIPAGTPHATRDESEDCLGLTIFAPAGAYAWDALAADVERRWQPGGWEALAALARCHRLAAAEAPLALEMASNEPIARIAGRAGVARETFTRDFARRYGMPPHAYRQAGRLDQARKLLRAGTAVAAVAAETGFADQSHLGRSFLRAFGVSPARYARQD